MSPDYTKMLNMLKTQPEFIDYITCKQRESEMRAYDKRIAALQSAKDTLANAPMYRIPKKDWSSLCQKNGWHDEDIAFFMEDFSRIKSSKPHSSDKGKIISGFSKLGQAIMFA